MDLHPRYGRNVYHLFDWSYAYNDILLNRNECFVWVNKLPSTGNNA